MTRKSTKEIASNAYLQSLTTLFANGYNDAVKAFTLGIQTSVDAVLSFEITFNLLRAQGVVNWEGTSSQKASMTRVEASLDGMKMLLDGVRRPVETYIVVSNHGNESTFELGWQDQLAGTVVWDRWTDEMDDPVMAFAAVGFLFDTRGYRCAPKSVEKPEPPLYRYHPERFKAFRDYADPVGKVYRQKVDLSSGMISVDQLNEIMRLVLSDLTRRSMNFPRKFKETHPLPSLVIEAEETLATAYGRFVQAGRQIMDFPPALTEMLAKTDIDDIPLNNIKLPYVSQYMHFGPQAELELEPGWLVDGAYVEQRGISGDLRFTITSIPSDHSASRQWYLFPEAEYTQDFVGNFRSMDLATAIDTVLSDRLANFGAQQAATGGDMTATIHAEFAKNSHSVPDGLSVVNVGPKMAALRDDITRRRHPVYKGALQLVVNALCYVASYPDDIDTVWPEGTPDSLRQKVLNGKGKEQMRAKSKLAALGYVPVHICGKGIVEQRVAHGMYAQEHGRVTTHWRRGHWRNQVHGPAKSLRKLIWVMPVIVGTTGHDDPKTGHLYMVS